MAPALKASLWWLAGLLSGPALLWLVWRVAAWHDERKRRCPFCGGTGLRPDPEPRGDFR